MLIRNETRENLARSFFWDLVSFRVMTYLGASMVIVLLLLIPSVAIQTSAQAITVQYQDKTYDVTTSLSNGNVKSISVDANLTGIAVVVETSKSTGDLVITLPRTLIDSKNENFDGGFIIFVDGNEADFVETSTTDTERGLKITIPAGSDEVDIVGSQIATGSPLQLNEQLQIPSWVKNNAKWWSDGSLGDDDFVKGIQYLIQKGVMKIPETQSGSGSSQKIPQWIKNNAGWWASGQISDSEFVKGIQYLVTNGIIKVSSSNNSQTSGSHHLQTSSSNQNQTNIQNNNIVTTGTKYVSPTTGIEITFLQGTTLVNVLDSGVTTVKGSISNDL